MDLLLGLSGSVNWDSESYPKYQDFVILPFFIHFFPSIRFILDRFVFEILARRLIFGKGYAKEDVKTQFRRKKINKFKESAWKCVYFFSSALLALFVTYGEPWFTNTRYFWVGPEDQIWPDQKMKLKLKGYYMYAAGFYIYSLFALFFWETRRSDFKVSMAHHISSVILIALSYVLRFGRVGSVVLAIHEGNDVFLEIGKMSKYSGYDRIASFTFPMFVFSWLILRLIYYPFWILWSTSYEVLSILDNKHNGMLYYFLLNPLLFCLLACHIYWGRLMFWMLVEQMQAGGQISEDIRSDSEGENEHED